MSKELGCPYIDVHVTTCFAHVVHVQVDSLQFTSQNYAEFLRDVSRSFSAKSRREITR